MTHQALIDTDFMQHLAAIRQHQDVPGLIDRFFKALDVKPYMHPLIYQRELSIMTNAVIRDVFGRSIVTTPSLESVLDTPAKKILYDMMVRDLYRIHNRAKFPLNDTFRDWQAGLSLGEIHSATLCAFLNSSSGEIWFLSDDGGAYTTITAYSSSSPYRPIRVLSRHSCCEYLRGHGQNNLQDDQKLTRKELRQIEA